MKQIQYESLGNMIMTMRDNVGIMAKLGPLQNRLGMLNNIMYLECQAMRKLYIIVSV